MCNILCRKCVITHERKELQWTQDLGLQKLNILLKLTGSLQQGDFSELVMHIPSTLIESVA